MQKENSRLNNIALALLTGTLVTSCAVEEKQAPNIIFIMSDDHASRAISCYGDSLNSTPNIDQLATDGVRFTNACVTNSISAPCRATILTGKHNHINGLMTNEHVFDGSQQTFPKLLQAAGYETGIVGKWHLKSDPTGFDYWKILPGQGDYYNPDFIDSTGRKREEGYVTNLITKFSLDWLKKQEKKPFCLLMQHKAPHRNWMPAPEYVNQFDGVEFPVPENFFDDYTTRSEAVYTNEMLIDGHMTPVYDLKLSTGKPKDGFIGKGEFPLHKRMTDAEWQNWVDAYAHENEQFFNDSLEGEALAIWKYRRYMHDYLATISSVDESVGEVIQYLKENDLYDNTIVVYTSDQGFYLGEHGWFDKRYMYEESLHTPLIIHSPKGMSKGEVSASLVQNLDFAPTFLDMLGLPIPGDMQGVSFKTVLENPDSKVRNDVYYHYYEYPGEHKVKRHYGIRTERYKLIHFYHDINAWEFYDLESDPNEMNNLMGNAAYSNLIDSLKIRLDQVREEYKVPPIEVELSSAIKEVKNLAKGKHITFNKQPSPKYADGANVLTNGKIREFNSWDPSGLSQFQAFEGEDLDVVIDLDKAVKVKSIKARFLDYKSPWIFPPTDVRFEVSTDGKTYQTLGSENRVAFGYAKKTIIEYSTLVDADIRFVKVFAKNFGLLPEDHPGAGNKAWLFADEIIVE